MKLTKRFLFTLLLLALTAGAWADTQQTLVVWLKNGSQVRYLLSDEPKTTFENGVLHLKTNKVSVSYQLQNVLRYTYEGDWLTDGIDQPRPGEVLVSQTENAVTFKGLADGTPVQVYSVDGVLLSTQTARKGITTEVSLAAMPAGTYILKVKEQTLKFHKK